MDFTLVSHLGGELCYTADPLILLPFSHIDFHLVK